MAVTIRKGLLGVQDIKFYTAASPTFSRTTSTGAATIIRALGATNIPTLNASRYFQTSNIERSLQDVIQRYVRIEHSLATYGAGASVGHHLEAFGWRNALAATSLQAAASNQFLREGIARLRLPEGTFTAATPIQLPRRTHIFGAGRATVVRASSTIQTSRVFSISGSVGATKSTLSANATADSSLVPLSSSSGFHTGDWIIVRSSAATSELHQIRSIAGNNLTVRGNLIHTFSSSISNASLIYPAELYLDRFRIASSSATQGIGVAATYLVNSRFGEYMEFEGQSRGAVQLRRSSGNLLYGNIRNPSASNATGNNIIDWSHHNLVSGMRVQTMTDAADANSKQNYRHGVKSHGTYTPVNLPLLDSSTSASPKDLAMALEFEGALGGASSTTDVFAKVINQGAIINALSLSTADVAIGDFDSTNKKFGTYSYILGAGNIFAIPDAGNRAKGTLSMWFRNLTAGDYLAYNPVQGLELFLDATGKLTAKVTERTTASETTKQSSTVAGSGSQAGNTTFQHACMRWRTDAEGGATTDLLQLLRNGATEGTQLSAQTFHRNPGIGGVWFFGAKRNDPVTWDKFSSMQVLPSAEGSNPWTAGGTTAGNSVSDGVLRTTGVVPTNNYSRTGAPLTGIDLQNMTVEFKLKVNSSPYVTNTGANSDSQNLVIRVRDDSMNRSFQVRIYDTHISISDNDSAPSEACRVFLDTHSWHVYRFTSSGTPNPTLTFYIDGVKVMSTSLGGADATANDLILFGDNSATTGANNDAEWEWVAYADEVAAPVAVSTSGNLDSIGLMKKNISDSEVALLQSSAVSEVYNATPSQGVTLPYTRFFQGDFTTASANYVAMSAADHQATYFVPGDGVTELGFYYSTGLFNDTATADMRIYFRISSIDDDGLGSTSAFAWGSIRADNIFAAAGNIYPMFDERNIVLPVGLWQVQLVWRTTAGNATARFEHYGRRITQAGFLP